MKPANAFLQAWEACVARAARPLPPSAADAARRSWFDTAAAMACGVSESSTRAAFLSCEPQAAAPCDVALILGTASHALDYDDVCMLATCHPSAPIVSALLALLPVIRREKPHTTFGEVLGAYALGTETMLRLGEWLGFRHYALGFHATSTLGTVGVAAAAAQVLSLQAEQAQRALAIAASSASGLRANFGTDTKPLHVGFAAAAGIRAALLARAGATASNDVWGAAGFANAFGGGDPVAALPWHGDTPWALAAPGFEHKRFPSCYLTHRMIVGVLEIRARQAAHGDERVSIDVELPRGGCAPLKHPRPTTGLQAKFSGPYCAAQAWLDGKVDLASFGDASVMRAQIQAQMERVVVRERDKAGEQLDTAPVKVTVDGSGWSDCIVVDWAPGSLADPMTRDELVAKWYDCLNHAGLTDDVDPPLELLDATLATPAIAVLEPIRKYFVSAIRRSNGRSPVQAST